MTARVELRDMRENKVLWENPSLMFRQEYEATSGTSVDSIRPRSSARTPTRSTA